MTNHVKALNIYFEQLTLANLVGAYVSALRGHHVYYFALGRLTGRVPFLNRLLLKPFWKAEYQISDFAGLSFDIHGTAIEVAESISRAVAESSSGALALWENTFRTRYVTQYLKKAVSSWSWTLIRDYLWLIRRSEDDHGPAQLVVAETPMARMVVAYLLAHHPHPQLAVKGISNSPFGYFQYTAASLLRAGEYFAKLVRAILRRGFVLNRVPRSYKISKEVLWGLGTGRRTDDFFVDDRTIVPQDLLFYYGLSPQGRVQPEALRASIDSAASKGYACVNFNRSPLPVSMVWKVLPRRYFLFPISMALWGWAGRFKNSPTGLLSQLAMEFLIQTLGWEIFLASYRPQLNLSQNDPLPDQVAETIVLNLHGAKNGGFQWADDTQWRGVPTAFLTYDVYFSWGALAQKFWQDNWVVEEIQHTGYIWGHLCRESMDGREGLRKTFLGPDESNKVVLALFDESPHPDTYTSETMLYDFYRLGVEILEKRSDAIVVASPKRFSESIAKHPRVLDLIDPYVKSGRLKIWGKEIVDFWQVVAISDVVVSMVMGVPYLEAICCGRTGFNYAPSRNHESPVYAKAIGNFVFDDFASLLEAVEKALDNPGENGQQNMAEILADVDPFRDLRGIDRMRSSIDELTATESVSSPVDGVPTARQGE